MRFSIRVELFDFDLAFGFRIEPGHCVCPHRALRALVLSSVVTSIVHAHRVTQRNDANTACSSNVIS